MFTFPGPLCQCCGHWGGPDFPWESSERLGLGRSVCRYDSRTHYGRAYGLAFCLGSRMIFAYADPPYPGNGHRYPEKKEVDHRGLLQWLTTAYGDGWVLSTSSPALYDVLPLCPRGARVMSWVKPFAVFKPNVGVAYAWEPVIVWGGRKRTRQQATVRDWVSANITLKKGLVGAKPEAFCEWILDVLNVQTGDELHDLYPGTGMMSQTFAKRTA